MIHETLKNIVNGSCPSPLLDNVVDLLLDNDTELSLDDQAAVLKTGIEFIRNHESENNITVGWKILKLLERKPCVRFDVLLNAEVIENLLIGTKPPHNPQEVLLLIDWCLAKDSKLCLVSTVQRNLTNFLHCVPFDDKLLADLCMFLCKHPECLPNDNELKKFCEALVACLSSFPMPAAQPAAIRRFQESVSSIREFVNMALKNKRDRRDIIYSCLKIIYSAIANIDDGREPYPGLAVILGLLEPDCIRLEVQNVLTNSSSYEVVKKALQIFCNWLTFCPRETHINQWIEALMNGLEAQEMYGILNDVTLETIEKLFGLMMLPALRNGVEMIVWHMLFRNLHSPDVFHKISAKIPAVMNQLNCENNKEALNFLCNYCYIMFDEFPYLKNEYEGVYKISERLARNRMIPKSEIRLRQWAPVISRFTPEFDTVLTTYQPTGRVGLHNLGNTCYMNSVLQALFMTHRFCFGLLEKERNHCQPLIWKLQTLFALLLHSRRPALSPADVLNVCRPPGFLPGQQQDSSEFLTYLLDVLHEQEARFVKHEENSITVSEISMEVDSGGGGDEIQQKGSTGSMSRWTTEEDLTGGSVLERKAQSLADCSQDGTEPENTEMLSSTLSGSADSGIHSVCGDEAGGVAAVADLPNLHSSLVQQIFGGKMVTCNECLTCHSQSIQTDTFTDIQLSFPSQEEDNKVDALDVQKLLDYFVSAEKLSGDNSYRCDKCSALTVGQRSVNILHAPSHLILTIKHFHYDTSTMQRTKLLHKMYYNEELQVPVVAARQRQQHYETYYLYAAVVHSGRSMDSGHYYTFSRDETGSWFVFNDEAVYASSFDELTNLKAVDTPYILFYTLPNENLQLEAGSHILGNLQPHLVDAILKDNELFIQQIREERRRLPMGTMTRTWNHQRKPDDDPPSSCGGGSSFSTSANRVVF